MKTYSDYSALVLREIKQVFDCIQEEEIAEFLKKIYEAERIFLLGVGREGLSTKAFAMRLMHLGKQAYWIWDDTTPGIQTGDLLLCTSGSGEIGHEVYICQRAKEQGAILVLITAAERGIIQSMSDLVVRVPAEAYHAEGNMIPTRQLMGNLFEQSLFIFFDIVSMMFKDEYDITDHEMEKRHRNIE